MPPRRQRLRLRDIRRVYDLLVFKLGISRRTVDEHTDALYRKFEVGSRYELMARFVSFNKR